MSSPSIFHSFLRFNSQGTVTLIVSLLQGELFYNGKMVVEDFYVLLHLCCYNLLLLVYFHLLFVPIDTLAFF